MSVSPNGELAFVNACRLLEYGGPCAKPSQRDQNFATWNVEGLTKSKIIELQRMMIQKRISIICIQETHQAKSDYYVTEEGFLLILSGTALDEREYAGVGFVVAPYMRQHIIGFNQATSRMASLKLRTSGGKTAVFTAYAPQSGRQFSERLSFYQELAQFVSQSSCHGPKLVLGDFNARLCQREPGEEAIIGEYVFGNAPAPPNQNANRHLLLEFCAACDLYIGNTLFDEPADRQVTCRKICTKPKDAISCNKFGQTDFVIVSKTVCHHLLGVHSDRDAALASHHYLLHAHLWLETPKRARPKTVAATVPSALKDEGTASNSLQHFTRAWSDVWAFLRTASTTSRFSQA